MSGPSSLGFINMSGHHPPSWNHHPMQVSAPTKRIVPQFQLNPYSRPFLHQVPPYIPRLPIAHMSNERPLGSSWHNNSGLPTGPPQIPPGCAQNPGGHLLNPEHNQFPYHGVNNRKHVRICDFDQLYTQTYR